MLRENHPAQPHSRSSVLHLIRRTGQSPVFSIQYLRCKASSNSGLIYTPQVCSNLDGEWSIAIGTETVQSIDTEWERVTIEENATGKEKRFGRMRGGIPAWFGRLANGEPVCGKPRGHKEAHWPSGKRLMLDEIHGRHAFC